jgi:aldose 1-epimerase
MTTNPGAPSRIERRPFGALPDGTPVELYRLANRGGTSVEVSTYGGIVVALRTRDQAGHLDDIVLGHAALEGYLAGNRPYLGALVGRYANRIAGGRFTLDGRVHQLRCNDGPHHLHGGRRGFDKVVWSASAGESARGASLELGHVSQDGEEGYPGRLTVTVTFTLDDDDQLRLDYAATADAPTHCNLTHHGYFNLDGTSDVLEHVLTLHARRFLPVDAGLIPVGELRAVTGTPMDFTSPTAIGARLGADSEQLRLGRGYDHAWVLDGTGGGLVPAASLVGPVSGRRLEVLTTEPALQFYSGNFLDGTITGKGGRVYGPRAGLCLETEHYPDSPNHPDFPSTVLRPGQAYRSSTVFRFTAPPVGPTAGPPGPG